MRPPCESDWHETRAVQAQPDTLGAADTTQAAPAGRQGGRKPKLATATLPQPHVGEQSAMCGRAGVKKGCNKESSKAKARANE